VSLDFLAEEPAADTSSHGSATPWKVAIIDDVSDVHDTTRLALSDLVFEGRGVTFVSAYSAEEAKTLFPNHPDIAVALVDVVMETDSAGLDLVEWIRDVHGDRLVRIILRTGQPGYAPETDVIVRYEIDDYKEKTELSRTKLMTLLISAFRGHRQIEAIDRNRSSLERLIKSLSNLYSRQAVDEFATGILTQLGTLLDVEPDGLVCAVETRADGGPGGYRVLAAGGELQRFSGAEIENLPDLEGAALIRRCIEQGENLSDPSGTALALRTNTGAQGAVYLKTPGSQAIDTEDMNLLRLFAINASVAYDNANLFEETRTLAFTDPVTGLSSFGAFCKIFEQARAEGRDLMVGLFDIYKFRETSHGLGEERGELLLQKIGERLTDGLEGILALARREGDEFAILFDRADEIDPEALVARLDSVFEAPIILDEATLAVRGRLGLARHGTDGNDPRTLARYAAIALNEVRRTGRGRVRLFEPSLQESASERLRLASMLTGTSNRTAFKVAFQPVFETATGRMATAEALLRFHGSDGSQLPTGKMIDAAEANGLIGDIGAWVLKQAMIEHMSLQEGVPRHRLNVNLSPQQVQTSRVYADVEAALAASGFPAELLNIEVTENLFLEDAQEVLTLLNWLRDKGAKIFIDDFGTGYSSLSYLGKLPVDGLKIDRSFVMNMDQDKNAAAVVGSVVAIADKVNLDVVAEGVETEVQHRMLTDLGVHKLQGFLLGEPAPSAQLSRFLQRGA
jgi:diguanylate cyclase (GGDEF)-like protein